MKLLFIPGFLCITALQASAALIAHYKFDESSGTTAVDSARGTAGLATFSPSAGATTWVTGQMGGAIDLDGSNDFFSALNPITDDLSNYSASVWIQRDGGSSWQTFLATWGSGTTGSNLFTLNGDNLQHYMYGGGGTLFSDSTASVTVGSGWRHVAVTYEGLSGTQILYIDGVAAKTKTGAPLTLNNGNTHMGIGAKLNDSNDLAASSSPGYFNGKIDDLTMWNETLTQAQITAIRTNGLSGFAVPEPASALLGGLGLLALLRRRRN